MLLRIERAARRRAFHTFSRETMPDTSLDVLCIGNAIVDVIADASDDFLAAEGLTKGTMRLIDAGEGGGGGRGGGGGGGGRAGGGGRVCGEYGRGGRGARRTRGLRRAGRARPAW